MEESLFHKIKEKMLTRTLINHRLPGKRFASSSFLDADSSKALTKFYHSSALVLAVLTPIAFLLSPSKLTLAVDLPLGVLFPLHSHIALNYVITDYGNYSFF